MIERLKNPLANASREFLHAVDVSSEAGQKAARYADAIPGGTGMKNLQRLKTLFEEATDPTPVEIYQAYHGDVSFVRPNGAATSNSETSRGFDPAEDPATTSDKARIKRAHDRAHDQGHTDAAAFLRGANRSHQRGFTELLFNEFLSGEA